MSNSNGQFTVDKEAAQIIAAAIDRLADAVRGCKADNGEDLGKTRIVAGMHVSEGDYINQYEMTEDQARAFVKYCVDVKGIGFGEGYGYLGGGSTLDYILILDNSIVYTSYEPYGEDNDVRDVTNKWLHYINKCQEL